MAEAQQSGYVPEPTARASLANGFYVFAQDMIPLLVVAFFVVMIGGLTRSLIPFSGPVRYLGIGGSLLIAAPLKFGLSFVCLRVVRSGKVSFEHLIAVLNRYPSVIVANTLISAAFVIPSLSANYYWAAISSNPALLTTITVPIAFVFYGSIVSYLYCVTRFVPFLLLEDELGGIAAIRESFRLSRGYMWQLLGICAVGFLSTALGLISILGLIPALIWWNLSLASLYHAIATAPEGWAIEDQEAIEAQGDEPDDQAKE
jgi:hypothetical protein